MRDRDEIEKDGKDASEGQLLELVLEVLLDIRQIQRYAGFFEYGESFTAMIGHA